MTIVKFDHAIRLTHTPTGISVESHGRNSLNKQAQLRRILASKIAARLRGEPIDVNELPVMEEADLESLGVDPFLSSG